MTIAATAACDIRKIDLRVVHHLAAAGHRGDLSPFLAALDAPFTACGAYASPAVPPTGKKRSECFTAHGAQIHSASSGAFPASSSKKRAASSLGICWTVRSRRSIARLRTPACSMTLLAS